MKKLLSVSLAALLLFTLMSGCSGTSPSASANAYAGKKIGMVSDSGKVDDKSFNQSAWEGITAVKNELGLTDDQIHYLYPNGENITAYTDSLQSHYDAGRRLIVCPGFLFGPAVYEIQDRLTDCNFVLIDDVPNNGEFGDAYLSKVADNTIAVMFAEHQSGFLAGLASALTIGEGKLGFVGGMAVPSVQRFNWGFQQGVKYANETYGTNCTMTAEDIVYEGSFTNAAAGQQLAQVMYDRGVKVVFGCGGVTGNGVIAEALERRKRGEDVWAVGVDTDQYDMGIYEEGKSAVLTSAMKGVYTSAYDLTMNWMEDEFKGGQTLMYDASNGGIALPSDNPNLSKDTLDKVADTLASMKNSGLTVSDQQGDLHP